MNIRKTLGLIQRLTLFAVHADFLRRLVCVCVRSRYVLNVYTHGCFCMCVAVCVCGYRYMFVCAHMVVCVDACARALVYSIVFRIGL